MNRPAQILSTTSEELLKTTQVMHAPTMHPVKDEKTQKLEQELYSALVKTRNDISQSTGFAPHSIASNKLLLDMAILRLY